MALAARLVVRQLGAESLPAILQCASIHSSITRCLPEDDAASNSSAATVDQQNPAARSQNLAASEQRQRPVVNRSQVQRRDSPPGDRRADSQQRPRFDRSAGSQQGSDRTSQASFRPNRGSFDLSQRNQQQQQRQQQRQQQQQQPAGDKPQSRTATFFRDQQGRVSPAPGSSAHSRDAPSSGQDLQRQRFQQANQPGPRQQTQSPPFRDQRNLNQPRTTPARDFPPFRDQRDRATPRHAMQPPQDFVPDPDDIPTGDAQRPRRKTWSQAQTGRRNTPSPARREGGRPGANLRGGGPSKGHSAGVMDPAQALGMPVPMDSEDMDMQDAEDADGAPDNRLARSQYNPRGVPDDWKDEIEDMDDQEDLDEARQISNMIRRLRSGELVSPTQQIKDNVHTLQMNMDPRLDVELNTPVLQEMQEPTTNDMLQMSGPLAQTMGITNEQDWQEITEGLQEEYGMLTKALGHGRHKARAQEETLELFVNDTMPRDHPMFPVVSQSLEVLRLNPNWNNQKKQEFMWRLVKDLS